MPDEVITVRQSGTVQVVSTVPAWGWRCGLCGWAGMGWTSENGARREAADHLWDDHQQAACDPNELGPLPFPHVWERVKGTDSTDRCERCGRYCGK